MDQELMPGNLSQPSDEEKKTHTIDDLNKCYNEANEVDSTLFAEQRSNVLLASGDHYTKKNSSYWGRIRDNAQISEDTKLRITKNHLHKICNIYINNIFSLAPDVCPSPKNEKELQDQKAAELHKAIWEDWKQEVRWKEKTRAYFDDFVKVGEVATKIMFNPMGGKLVGYEQALDEFGQPIFDPMTGEPELTDRAVFSGGIEIERIFAPNLLRDPNSQDMYEGYLIYRKMVDRKTLEKQYADDEEKLKFLKGNDDKTTYTVFQGSSNDYQKTRDQILVREHYYPPCGQYPEGYYYICVAGGILEQGKLPFGVMPIVVEGFDEIPTSPRKRSIIKQLRPVQAELNRAASQYAMHQITVADDKLLVQTGTKVTQSAKLPGVRVMNYAGAPPTILQGRAGDQFVTYIEMQQREMYVIANLEEEVEEKKSDKGIDPYTELFKSIRHKKKYSIYAEKMESFLKRVCEIVLIYAKNYYSDERLIAACGMNEISNISEIRNNTPIGWEVKLEPQSEDVETKMGKQITLMQTIQYVGQKLDKQDIGKILRVMPFTNREEIFSDYTLDFDNATNDILALDRGEYPTSSLYDDHEYAIKRLENRKRQPDFQYLSPEIQTNYTRKIQELNGLAAMKLQKIKQAQSEFIPSGGYLVGCDFYVTDPENPGRTRRARVPYESLNWLVKQLEAQGSALEDLEQLSRGGQAEIADQLLTSGAGVPGNTNYQEPTSRPVSASSWDSLGQQT